MDLFEIGWCAEQEESELVRSEIAKM